MKKTLLVGNWYENAVSPLLNFDQPELQFLYQTRRKAVRRAPEGRHGGFGVWNVKLTKLPAPKQVVLYFGGLSKESLKNILDKQEMWKHLFLALGFFTKLTG